MRNCNIRCNRTKTFDILVTVCNSVSNFNKLCDFVTDYVGFIKKIMKLMLHKYSTIKKIEVELKQLEEPVNLPARPCKYNINFLILFKFLYNYI